MILKIEKFGTIETLYLAIFLFPESTILIILSWIILKKPLIFWNFYHRFAIFSIFDIDYKFTDIP